MNNSTPIAEKNAVSFVQVLFDCISAAARKAASAPTVKPVNANMPSDNIDCRRKQTPVTSFLASYPIHDWTSRCSTQLEFGTDTNLGLNPARSFAYSR